MRFIIEFRDAVVILIEVGQLSLYMGIAIGVAAAVLVDKLLRWLR